MLINIYGLLLGLDSFMIEEVIESFDYLGREIQPGSTRHYDVSALVDNVLRKPDARGSSSSLFFVSPFSPGVPIGSPAMYVVTNPSRVNLGTSDPITFQIHSDPSYQRPQVDMHVAPTVTSISWVNTTLGSSNFTFAQQHSDTGYHTSFAQPQV